MTLMEAMDSFLIYDNLNTLTISRYLYISYSSILASLPSRLNFNHGRIEKVLI